jgi:hypothetical protein
MDKGGVSIIMFPTIEYFHKKKILSKGENIAIVVRLKGGKI